MLGILLIRSTHLIRILYLTILVYLSSMIFSSYHIIYHYGKLPVSFNNKFTPLMGSNRTLSYRINVAKNKSLEKFPTNFLPKIWNSTSTDCKKIENLKAFSRNIKNSYSASYGTFTCSRGTSCFSCNAIDWVFSGVTLYLCIFFFNWKKFGFLLFLGSYSPKDPPIPTFFGLSLNPEFGHEICVHFTVQNYFLITTIYY